MIPFFGTRLERTVILPLKLVFSEQTFKTKISVVFLRLQFLQFCPTILKPNLDLKFLKRKRRCQMLSLVLAQVRVRLELRPQRGQLGGIEIGPGSFVG